MKKFLLFLLLIITGTFSFFNLNATFWDSFWDYFRSQQTEKTTTPANESKKTKKTAVKEKKSKEKSKKPFDPDDRVINRGGFDW